MLIHNSHPTIICGLVRISTVIRPCKHLPLLKTPHFEYNCYYNNINSPTDAAIAGLAVGIRITLRCLLNAIDESFPLHRICLLFTPASGFHFTLQNREMWLWKATDFRGQRLLGQLNTVFNMSTLIVLLYSDSTKSWFF
jgi:hypothetical protein